MHGRGTLTSETRLLVELSGEQPNLAISEALGGLKGLGQRPGEVVYEPRFLTFRAHVSPEALAGRLALARYMGEVLLSGTVEDVISKASGVDMGGRRFRVRARDYTGRRIKPSLEASIGGALAFTGKVDLETPEVDLRAVVSRRAYLYLLQAEVDRSSFEFRKPENRPFFLPVSLHPRFARALVNLTGVRRGQVLLDPFCGTGGILMEAALVGARAVGSDVRSEVVEGCADNLEAFGLEAELFDSDVGDVPQRLEPVDAIATDPPYGRAAGTMRENVTSLMERAFRAFQRALKQGGRLAICLPELKLLDIGRRYLRLVEWHSLPVHRSLTRHFAVFEKA
jgi:tRNA (guanine10-N2)-dimethyltransferase